MIDRKQKMMAIQLARELGYPKETQDRIKNATREYEIQLALKSAREMMSKIDNNF